MKKNIDAIGRNQGLPIGLLLALTLLFTFGNVNNYYITIGVQALIYSILVIGLNFITGMTGQMNMGMGGAYCLGAYSSAVLCTTTGLSPWIGLAFAFVMGILVGLLLGYPSLRVQGVYLSLTTLGFSEIVRIVMNNLAITGGSSGLRDIPRFSLFGISIKGPISNFYFILCFLIAVIIIANRIIRSKYGRAFIAIRDNVDAVETCGINLAKTKITAFTLSTICGACAGAFYASFNGYITPGTFTTDLGTSFVVALIVGGRGRIMGCLIGAFIIAFVNEMLRFLGDYYLLVYGVVVMILIIFNPNGLVALGDKVVRFVRSRKKGA